MTDSKIFLKIKKCLALSTSSNANEAATALRQAQALMAQYNLSISDVSLSEVSEAKTTATAKKPPTWLAVLANKMALAFNCHCLLETGFFDKNWCFIGVGESALIAQYAFVVLMRQINRDRSLYIKTSLKRCKPATKTRRADLYCEAWVCAATDKLLPTEVCDNRVQILKEYLAKKNIHKKEANDRTSKGRLNGNDYIEGKMAGKAAQLHKGMNGKKQALLESL